MIKDFIRNSSLYFLILILERFFLFLISPLLVRSIPLEDYGIYSLFLTLEGAILPLVSLNIYSGISKEYYDIGFEFREYTARLFSFSTLLFFVFLVVFSAITSIIPGLFPFNNKVITICISTALLSSLIVYFQTFFKLKNDVFRYGIVSLSISISYASIVYILAKYFYTAVDTVFLLRLFIYLFFAIILLIVHKSFYITLRLKPIINTLRLTLPTVVFSISAFLFVMADRLLISKYLGDSVLGEYSAVYQIPALISIIIGAFSSAWVPWLYERLNSNLLETKRHVTSVIYILLILLFLGCCTFYFLIPFLGSLIYGDEINFEHRYIIFLVIGFFFQGIYNMFSPFVFFSGRTLYHAIIGVVVAVISLILNFILIPKLGLTGAAITFSFSWFLLSVGFTFAAIKTVKMPWFFYKY